MRVLLLIRATTTTTITTTTAAAAIATATPAHTVAGVVLVVCRRRGLVVLVVMPRREDVAARRPLVGHAEEVLRNGTDLTGALEHGGAATVLWRQVHVADGDETMAVRGGWGSIYLLAKTARLAGNAGTTIALPTAPSDCSVVVVIAMVSSAAGLPLCVSCSAQRRGREDNQLSGYMCTYTCTYTCTAWHCQPSRRPFGRETKTVS